MPYELTTALEQNQDSHTTVPKYKGFVSRVGGEMEQKREQKNDLI